MYVDIINYARKNVILPTSEHTIISLKYKKCLFKNNDNALIFSKFFIAA